ncbi:MAG: hypothetical protein H0X29_09120 [Parachlamydiaceae bacterium]|nr:hypothetical protein [Parachlamydiaceae bacterium]
MNIFKYVIASLIFSSFPITLQSNIPEEEMLIIDSELADYNGKNIILQGNVVIEHMLGTISANHMTLHTAKKKEFGPFGLLEMHDRVKLNFRDGEVLSCAKAEVDYQALTGSFFGNEVQEFVTYTESEVEKKEGKTALAPLNVKSRRMTIRLASKEMKGDKKLPKNNVSALTADEQVTVNYNNDFTVIADHAIYQRMSEDKEAEKAGALPGIITMKSAKVDGTCQVSNLEGDVIRADQIGIDTVKLQLTFNDPKGTLKRNDSAKGIKQIDFSAEKLVWDDLAGVLALSKQVVLNQQGMGKLETPHEVRFYQHIVNHKKVLKAIESLSETVLTYREEDKNFSHTLSCSGPVTVDHEKMETRLVSNKNDFGDIDEARQVHFEDSQGEIFADKVLIKYALLKGSISVSKIYLVGNVKIYNRLNSAEDETIVVLQYALADRVDFRPHTKEMLFKSSNTTRRVLFFDKTNNLQVSAPALKIIRDKATGIDSIKGDGDVRFSLLESEFEQLRKRFSLCVDTAKNEKNASTFTGDR